MKKVIAKELQESWVDKSSWGPGPWQQEPDRIEWRGKRPLPLFDSTRRIWGSMWLCRGTGKPPWYMMYYNEVPAEVHGGLTYGDMCRPESHICHTKTKDDFEPYWLGFDTGHFGDLCPGANATYAHLGGGTLFPGRYRDVGYVKAEIENLLEQALNAANIK